MNLATLALIVLAQAPAPRPPASNAPQAPPTAPRVDERLAIDLGKGWRNITDTYLPGEARILEYIPEGQALDAWTEMFTIQIYYKAPNVPPRGMFMDYTVAHEKHCPGTSSGEVLAEDATSLLFEFRAQPCLGWPARHELARFLKGQLFYKCTYVRRGADAMPDPQRERWIKTLSAARLQKPQPPAPRTR